MAYPRQFQNLRVWFLLLSLTLLVIIHAPAHAATAIRVNAGDGTYTDSAANVWSADNGFGPSSTVNWGGIPIAGTSDPTLFRTERYAATLSYAVAVPNGSYQVRLYFAENYIDSTWPGGGIGLRLFNIQLEGVTVATNLDIMAAVGAHSALIKTYTTTVSDGQLNIVLAASANNALVNAIEITDVGGGSTADTTPPTIPTGLTATALNSTTVSLAWGGSTDSGTGLKEYRIYRDGLQLATVPAGTTTFSDASLAANTAYVYTVSAADLANPTNESLASLPTSVTTPVAAAVGSALWRIHAGGAAFVDNQGNSWSADTLFNTGAAVSWGSVSIANAVDSRIYQTERYDPNTAPELQYDLPVANGTYTVRLHFAENYITNVWPNGGVGARVFSVQAEGTTVLSSLDIVAQAGTRAALVKTFSVTVADGSLTLRFVHGIENPLVNGIEVLSTADTTPPSVPTGLTAVAQSSSAIRLSWNASTDTGTGVGGYRIRRNGTVLTTTASTSFTDATVAPSTTYTYTVSAYDLASPPNESQPSGSATATTPAPPDTTPPTVPGSLTAAALSSSSIQLGWTVSTDSGTGVGGYRLRRNGTVLTTMTGTSFTDTGLAPGTLYSYTVTAFDLASPPNESQPSSSASATTLPDTTPPAIPGSLTATAQGSTAIVLGWSASSDSGTGVGGYRIRRDGAVLTTVTGTGFTDTLLTPGTTYSYTVSAFDLAVPANESQSSNSAVATTQAAPDTTPPTVPLNLVATAQDSGSIQLGWSASTDSGTGVGGYRVRRDGAVLTTVTGTSFTDTGLVPATTYSYTVTAYDRATSPNESAPSSSAGATTLDDTIAPSVPGGLVASAIDSSSIQLGWIASTDVGAGVAGYRISRDGAVLTTVSGTAFTDTGLTPSTTYSYTVTAFDLAATPNESTPSSSATARTLADTTPPSVPSGVIVTALDTTSILLRWTASTDVGTGVGGYRIWRNGAVLTTVTGTSFTDTLLTPSTTYSYSVSAYDLAATPNESVPSAAVSARTPAVPDTTPPSLPTGLAATVLGGTSILLNWNASTDVGSGVGGYRLYRDGVQLATIQRLFYVDSGLAATSTHTYKVSAYDLAPIANESLTTAEVTATTGNLDPKVFFRFPVTDAQWAQADLSSAGSYIAPQYSIGDANDAAPIPGLGAHITGARALGLKVLGHVDGLDSEQPLATIKAKIDLWYASFPDIAGIFVGDAGWNAGIGDGLSYTDYWAAIGAYIHSKGGIAVLHPGGQKATEQQLQTLLGSFETLVLYEEYLPYVSGQPQLPVLYAWMAGYPREKFAVLVNGIASGDLLAVQNYLLGMNVGFMYLTDVDNGLIDGGDYWASEVLNLTTPLAALVDTVPPNAPTGLLATAHGSSLVTLAWTAATDSGTGVAGYQVFRGSTSIGTTTGTSFADTGRAPLTTYSYTVVAFDGGSPANYSSPSAPAVATTATLDTTPPTLPTGLTAAAYNTTSVALAWNPATDSGSGVGGYHVYRGGVLIATTASGVTSYRDIALTPNTSYSYSVSAFDNESTPNESAPTAPVGVTTPASSVGVALWRIKAGGAGFTDSLGNVWSADAHFNTGNVASWGATPIAGTVDDAIYQSERWDADGGPELQYDLPVPNGTYQVRLHFAENYVSTTWGNGGVGQRIFSVQAQGVTVLPNLDIIAEAGPHAALIKTLSVTVSDGMLSLRFLHGVQNPLLDGIEVIAQQAEAPTYNVGFQIITYASGRKAAVWYPTLDAAGQGTYANGLSSDFVQNAAPVSGHNFPLIIYSHGDGNCGTGSVFITEALARNGFIVAAPDHPDAMCSVDGGPVRGPDPVAKPLYTSPAQWNDTTVTGRRDDLRTLTGYMLASATFAPNIDAQKIALVGYSLGGYSSLALLGGWTSWLDTRFKAALLLSPYSAPFLDKGTLASITVPLMYQGGTADSFMTPYIEGPVAPYATGAYDAANHPKYFAKILGADHVAWTIEACAVPGSVSQCLQDAPSTAVMATYAVAFFQKSLNGVDQPLLRTQNSLFSTYQFSE